MDIYGFYYYWVIYTFSWLSVRTRFIWAIRNVSIHHWIITAGHILYFDLLLNLVCPDSLLQSYCLGRFKTSLRLYVVCELIAFWVGSILAWCRVSGKAPKQIAMIIFLQSWHMSSFQKETQQWLLYRQNLCIVAYLSYIQFSS